MMTDDYFSEYVRHLARLHELIAQGPGDSDEADTVRDRMDAPWSQLNRRQIELADGLSSDLYTLGTNRSATGLKHPNVEKFAEAVQREDWAGALKFIRRQESSLSPASVAILRGACWAHLKQPEIALRFIEESIRIKPPDSETVIWHLFCLIQSGRAIDAVPRARELLDKSSDLMLRRAALEVLFAAASNLPDAERRTMLPEACQFAESLLSDNRWGPQPDQAEAQLALWLHLAISYLDLDDDHKAKHACLKALQFQPDNRSALELLGFLNYADFPQEARRHFVQRHQQEAPQDFSQAPLAIA
jgi:tetratricopeptide (TPR) repeat protein